MAKVRDLLRESGLDKEDVSSFIASNNDFQSEIKELERIAIEEVPRLLNLKEKAVLMFEPNSGRTEARILHTQANAANKNSKLFENMTPSTLSALFVTLFLIIMLLIGINCLYNIKTNDKFGKNNLWVGKES